ncbi:1637_t:CDS:1, partial [Dentiscutata heterogama]
TSVFRNLEDEFEDEELEDRIYGFSELEDQEGSSEEDDTDDGYENINPNNLGEGEAWWNLNSDDDYVREDNHEWNQEEYNYEEEEPTLFVPLNPWHRDQPWLLDIESSNDEWDKEQRVDESTELTPPDLAEEPYEEITDLFDFYFDEEENPVARYNVKTLPKDQEEEIEVILAKNLDLFAKSLSELGRTNKCCHRIITADTLPIKQRPY